MVKRIGVVAVLVGVLALQGMGGVFAPSQPPAALAENPSLTFPHVMIMGASEEAITAYLLTHLGRHGFSLVNQQDGTLTFEDNIQNLSPAAVLGQGIFGDPGNPNVNALDRLSFNLSSNSIGTLVTLRRFRLFSPGTPFEKSIEYSTMPEWLIDSMKGLHQMKSELEAKAPQDIPE
jgi:hypothetical protein